MNLYRWVKGLGLMPRVMGNVKGLQDPYRNPTTQQGFAEKWGQNPAMVTSFADGSKISFEQAIVANATGFKVQSRGMSRGVEYRGSIDEHRASSTTSTSCAQLGRHRRLRGRPAGHQGVLPGRASRSEAAALPQSLQDGRGAALPVLHSLPSRALRGAERHRPRRAVRDDLGASRSAARSSRSAPWPSATWRPARCSTITACT